MKILHRYTNAVLWESPCSTLRDANLCGANLRDANLCGANLRDANLRGANLCDANLCGADLCDANLCGADLHGANLCGANLCDANLRDANLCDANLCGADLHGAKNADYAIAQTRILPEGEIIGWKKALSGNKAVIVQLRIPATARRSHAFGRKCRASEAIVIAIDGAKSARSQHDPSFKYSAGQTLTPKEPFCDDWQLECASGIHFFITRIEAENYSL